MGVATVRDNPVGQRRERRQIVSASVGYEDDRGIGLFEAHWSALFKFIQANSPDYDASSCRRVECGWRRQELEKQTFAEVGQDGIVESAEFAAVGDPSEAEHQRRSEQDKGRTFGSSKVSFVYHKVYLKKLITPLRSRTETSGSTNNETMP